MKRYFVGEQINDVQWPNVDHTCRPVYQGLRNHVQIPGLKAVVDKDTNFTYAVVSEGYKVVKHQEVLSMMEEICYNMPEYGTPTKEIWLTNHGGRLKIRFTFRDVDFEIGKLPNGEPDIVYPTAEAFCSYDTTLSQRVLVGGFRLICTNGMVVGKILGEYKRKHTVNLDLDVARARITQGMADYSNAVGLWQTYLERNASLPEVNCYRTIGFNKTEKLSVEAAIKRIGNVKKWDDEEPENNDVEINAWSLMNIYTEEASHRVDDVTRRSKISDNIAKSFK